MSGDDRMGGARQAMVRATGAGDGYGRWVRCGRRCGREGLECVFVGGGRRKRIVDWASTGGGAADGYAAGDSTVARSWSVCLLKVRKNWKKKNHR